MRGCSCISSIFSFWLLPLLVDAAEYVDLAYNRFGGPFPDSIFEAPSLMHLDLSLNDLTGQLPENLQKAGNSKLLKMALFNNSLTGSIPTSIGRQLELQELHLEFNKFHGQIPTELGNCQQLSKSLPDPHPRCRGPFFCSTLNTNRTIAPFFRFEYLSIVFVGKSPFIFK